MILLLTLLGCPWIGGGVHEHEVLSVTSLTPTVVVSPNTWSACDGPIPIAITLRLSERFVGQTLTVIASVEGVEHTVTTVPEDAGGAASIVLDVTLSGEATGLVIPIAGEVRWEDRVGTFAHELSVVDAPAWYPDADGDGAGAGFPVYACVAPPGHQPSDVDCDDADPEVGPGQPERCNGVDDDCAGGVPADEQDADGDGFVTCAPWGGDPALLGGDCDDGEATSHPGATEICGDGVDSACDGDAEDEDFDGDGSLACVDCDDGDDFIAPGMLERCNGLDDDCDGIVPDQELDPDQDGYSACAGDCEPDNTAVFPGADERCNGADDDCNGMLPDDERDRDMDGFVECDPGADDLDVHGPDCDDDDPTRSPGALEVCNLVDDDCDGSLGPDELDLDGDQWILCDPGALLLQAAGLDGAGDCDDQDPDTNPGEAEVCDGVDQDCDGTVDEGTAGFGYVTQDGLYVNTGLEDAVQALAGPADGPIWMCEDWLDDLSLVGQSAEVEMQTHAIRGRATLGTNASLTLRGGRWQAAEAQADETREGGAALLTNAALILDGVQVEGHTGVTPWAEGGAFALHGSTLHMTGGSIEGGFAGFGGAIMARNGSAVTLDGTLLAMNVSHPFGGGAVLVSESSLTTLGDASFLNNMSRGNGGAVRAVQGATVTLGGATTLTGNHTDILGGAVYVEDSTLLGTNAEFANNSADDGGAVDCTAGSTVDLTTPSFTSNSVTGTGGAIRLRTCDVTIAGGVFTSNVSSSNAAGAVGIEGPQAVFGCTFCRFTSNSQPVVQTPNGVLNPPMTPQTIACTEAGCP